MKINNSSIYPSWVHKKGEGEIGQTTAIIHKNHQERQTSEYQQWWLREQKLILKTSLGTSTSVGKPEW